MRECTETVLKMIAENRIDIRKLAEAAIMYMDENEVRDMIEAYGFMGQVESYPHCFE